MKKATILLSTLMGISLLFNNCAKKEETVNPSNNTAKGTFTWKENGTLITADSAWYNNTLGSNTNANQTNIYARKGTNMYFFEINIASKTTGSTSLTTSELNYIKSSDLYGSTAGTLTFSKYDASASKISGTFSATVKNQQNVSISITEGAFTDLSKK